MSSALRYSGEDRWKRTEANKWQEIGYRVVKVQPRCADAHALKFEIRYSSLSQMQAAYAVEIKNSQNIVKFSQYSSQQ